MASKSSASVTAALSTDRHSWEKNIQPLDMRYYTATFRGEDDKTLFEIYYAFQTEVLLALPDSLKNELLFERGVAIHDLDWNKIYNNQDSVKLSVETDKLFIDSYRCFVDPDSYHVSIHGHPQSTSFLGGFKFDEKIDDYSGANLAMSSIQLANKIEPAQEENQFVKNDLLIVPNPALQFEREEPIHIYFEIYHLSQKPDRKTNFAVEYSLTQTKSYRKGVKKLFRLFGGRSKTSVTIRADREGQDEFSVEFLAIDISKYEPGEYELKVKVTDLTSGDSTERVRGLYLL
jgi:hypothetical protein